MLEAEPMLVPSHREQLASQVRRRASELGFDAVGMARADEPLEEEYERWLSYLRAGHHGQMGYLGRHRELRRRVDIPELLSGAKTVVCLARRYGRGRVAEERDPPLARHIARYARGRDYHGFLRRRLNQLAQFIRSLAPGVETRICCDTAPVLERAWAVRAGIGFCGKNGLLIVPGHGSYVLLGEVLTTLELPPSPPCPGECGSCVACLEACPSRALIAPYQLDARECLSYATIEQPDGPPFHLRHAIGFQLFGCDQCQQSCPHNLAPRLSPADTHPFEPLPIWSELGLGDLCRMSAAEWAELATGSPLRRLDPLHLARNALTVAWNLARQQDQAAQQLLRSASSHPEPAIRSWAEQLWTHR